MPNDKWTDADLLDRARKLHHRFLNETEGEYVALVIGRLINAIEDAKEDEARRAKLPQFIAIPRVPIKDVPPEDERVK